MIYSHPPIKLCIQLSVDCALAWIEQEPATIFAPAPFLAIRTRSAFSESGRKNERGRDQQTPSASPTDENGLVVIGGGRYYEEPARKNRWLDGHRRSKKKGERPPDQGA